MYVHLNKKITVPNCNRVRTISWSSDHEFIACGGENGVLKVIKLEANLSSLNKGDNARNFSHNQTLESHKTTVQHVCWNEPFQKLTSSDDAGSIIVWMLYKGMWYEEMVNNRNKSLVTGMAWTFDGQKICIVYDDGAIITGSVDGNRIWGKDIKNANLAKVEWSPDGKTILIGTNELEIQSFDNMGNFVKKVPLATLQALYGRSNAYKDAPNLVSIRWFKNSTIDHPLIVAFEDGWLQLMKNEADDFPVLINTELKITSVEWNYAGDMFAVTGNGQGDDGTRKNYLKLFTNEGDMLQMVKVPGSEISDCSWDRSGLKLALAVDTYIFFASVKPNYHWGFLTNSIVFALPIHSSDHGKSKKLIFKEIRSNETYEREVNNFIQMATWMHSCAVVSKVEGPTSNSANNALSTGEGNKGRSEQTHFLALYNSIGTLMDRHMVNMKVRHCCINSTQMIVASDDSFYVWTLNPSFTNGNVNLKNVHHSERLYNELALQNGGDGQTESVSQTTTLVSRNDPISCMHASEKNLLVASHSGIINQFLLPNAVRVHQIQVDCIPYRLAMNRNSSKLSLIDKSSKLYIYDFDATNNEQTDTEGDWLDVKLQDVWDMRWASDNPDLLAVCEKSRLVILHSNTLEREEPVPSNGNICSFEQLRVKTLLLDSLVVDTMENAAGSALAASKPVDGYLDIIDSQSIREVKDIMEQSLPDAVNYILQGLSSPTLWAIIGEYSLSNLQLDTANLAMIKCKDYKGLQFVKKLNKLSDPALKQAQVFAYLNRFEEAESIYIEHNRPEVAIHLNEVLGRYSRVIELLEKHRTANHRKEIESARTKLAQFHADHCEWAEAAENFEKVGAYEQLVNSYIHMENYNGLVRLIDRISGDSALLTDIGLFLQSMGLCKDSARALVKAGKVERAIDVCVSMSEWKLAIDLAHEHNFENIDSILSQYVDHLLIEQKYIEIVEVYRKANKISNASAMVITLIGELKKSGKGDAALFKKLFVLIGMLHQEGRKKANKSAISNALDDLLTTDEAIPTDSDKKIVEDPWKGAEAYHFFLLTQRHLYEGYYDLAMKTALHLQDYEEFLSNEEIYSLIALASYSCKCFSVCSRAFIKLEAMSSDRREPNWNASVLIGEADSEDMDRVPVSEDQREKYEKLAIDIFGVNAPNGQSEEEGSQVRVECKFCGSSIPDYSICCAQCNTKFVACIVSGKSIMDSRQQWSCKQCNHQAIKTEIKQYNNCPLCHFRID